MRESGLGRGMSCGPDDEAEDPTFLALLASFTSFFQETYVVSPGRSSTVNTWRSRDFINDEVGRDDDSPPPPSPAVALLSSCIGKSGSTPEDCTLGYSNWRIPGVIIEIWET